jgi:hypothetical protein
MKQKSLHLICLITLSFLLSGTTLSQAKLFAQVKPPLTPNTAAGRRLGEWQRAYNSGDYDQTRKFMADNYAKAVLDLAPADVRANNVVNTLRVNGKMKIIAIEKSSETDIAFGRIYAGTFTATPIAKTLSRAFHFQGPPVRVTARLSGKSGDPNKNRRTS